MKRIAAVGLSLALAIVAGVASLRAEEFPSRPIKLLIGFPPGSAADITARVVSAAMSETLGQQIVVEARTGAGSSLAAEAVVRSPPDGYTLGIGTSSNLTNAAISTNLRFDFVRELAPITPLTALPMILTTHPGLGVVNLKDLIALAKAKPGELTYASVGIGTVPHLGTELLSARTGMKLVHVPYQGSPAAVTDLLAGRVAFSLVVASTVIPHIEAGRLVGIAAGSAKRAHIAPNLPTIAEAGVPDYDTSVWFGLMAPLGTPRPIIDKLAAAANAALKAEAVATKLRAQGFEPLGSSPDEFAEIIKRDAAKWNAAAEAAGLRKGGS